MRTALIVVVCMLATPAVAQSTGGKATYDTDTFSRARL
jgi:ribosomal protein S27E